MLNFIPAPTAAQRVAIWHYISSTLSLAGGLVAHTVGIVILARALGAEQFGQFSIITTVSNLGLAWCGLGGGEALRRLLARDPAIYPQASGHAIILIVLPGALLSLILAFGLSFTVSLGGGYWSNLLIMLLLVSSNIILFSWIGLAEQILLAHDNLSLANWVNMGSGLSRAGLIALACLVFGVSDTGTYAYWHFAYYGLVSLACVLVVARYGWPKFVIIREELFRGATISVANLFIILRQNADILALGAVAAPSVVGYYSVARRIVGTASVVSSALDRMVYSSFARAGRDGPKATLNLAIHYCSYAAVLCFTTSGLLYILAPYLPLVFSKSYDAAVPIVQVLSWTLILTSLQYLASDALNASDRHASRLAAEVTSGLLGVVGLVALTMAFGLDGIVASVYLAGILVAGALWGTLAWLATCKADRSADELSLAPPAI